MAGKIYVSKINGIADYDGAQVTLVAGVTRVREGHPLLEGRESVFEEVSVDYEVETARQAPKAEAKPDAPKAEAKPDAAEAKGSADESKAEAAKPGPKPPAAKPQRGPRRTSGAGS